MKVIMKVTRGYKIEELRKLILANVREFASLIKEDYDEIMRTENDPRLINLINAYVDDLLTDIIRELRKSGWISDSYKEKYFKSEGEQK